MNLILSEFARHNILLSSSTVFIFSIQTASTGPSQTIHWWSCVVNYKFSYSYHHIYNNKKCSNWNLKVSFFLLNKHVSRWIQSNHLSIRSLEYWLPHKVLRLLQLWDSRCTCGQFDKKLPSLSVCVAECKSHTVSKHILKRYFNKKQFCWSWQDFVYFQNCSFSCASWTDQHNTVTNPHSFMKLNNFVQYTFFRL